MRTGTRHINLDHTLLIFIKGQRIAEYLVSPHAEQKYGTRSPVFNRFEGWSSASASTKIIWLGRILLCIIFKSLDKHCCFCWIDTKWSGNYLKPFFLREMRHFCRFGTTKHFSIIVFCVSNGMFLKAVDESTLLFEDQCLTLRIDKAMVVGITWKGRKISVFCEFYNNLSWNLIVFDFSQQEIFIFFSPS